MALASHQKKKTTRKSTATSKNPSKPAARSSIHRRYAEAPDRGLPLAEAPEEPRDPREEAPDWGDSVQPEQTTFHNCS